ncbi:MAG: segregation/condensation protein A [Deltaproteobacteria bacterium]|nr:segregation/condensation protein A [Deltaproteobacteria bacterium]
MSAPGSGSSTEYWVQLEVFEGPLDLLLHIIKKHELDVMDIPVAFVLECYLEYITAMKEMQLDIAAEYLAMAATLVYIKSKMLLPVDESEEEEEEECEDPRAELVRRLLEYKKYREAAAELAGLSVLGAKVFTGGFEPELEEREIDSDVGLFDLVERVNELIREARERGVTESDLIADRITVADRITELAEMVAGRQQLTFRGLLPGGFELFDVVITFLAILEMTRLRMIRLVQADGEAEILVMAALRYEGDDGEEAAEEAAGEQQDG